MQRAISPRSTVKQFQTQATRVLPGHGTAVDGAASNDDIYHDQNTPLGMVLSVLANVIGGILLLSGMFFLPQLIAEILG